jgi:hypothetical protein
VAITPAAGQGATARRPRSTSGGGAGGWAEDRSGSSSASESEAKLGLQPEPPKILASGVFVTGSVGLQIGCRYLIEVAEDRLRVLGPADQDPTAVAFERSIQQMDATGLNERLILSERGSSNQRSVLAFISLAGGTPSGVADEVLQHSQQVQGSAP